MRENVQEHTTTAVASYYLKKNRSLKTESQFSIS